jgi:hypothetical protein
LKNEIKAKLEVTMTDTRNAFKLAALLGTLCFLALVISISSTIRPIVAAPAGITLASPHGSPPDASSLSTDVLIIPEDLAKALQSPKGEKPLIIHVGFHVLYSQGHASSAEFMG